MMNGYVATLQIELNIYLKINSGYGFPSVQVETVHSI